MFFRPRIWIKRALGSSGQALIETALMLPFLGLFVFGVVWLMCFCRNSIMLQKFALNRAQSITANPQQMLQRPLFHLWGRSTPSYPTTQMQRPSPWRPFIPSMVPPILPTVLRTEGSVIRVECKSILFSGMAFTRRFLPTWQEATAETFVEPPLPAES